MEPRSVSLGASCAGSPSPWGGGGHRQTPSEKEQVSTRRTQYLLTVAVGQS